MATHFTMFLSEHFRNQIRSYDIKMCSFTLHLVKPLSHHGGVLTATARRATKTQNAEVGSPRAPRDHHGIAVASPLDTVGSPQTPCHGAFLSIHKMRAVAQRSRDNLNERRENALGSQWQCSNNAVRYPRALRGRRAHPAGTHMIAARTLL